jgi:Cft2 family RNA processing exonuclease
MRERLPGKRKEHIVSFDEPCELAGLPGVVLRLLPAGHIFGSAQLHLESEARLSPLQRRFQAPAGTLCRSGRVPARRDAGNGDHLRPSTLPLSTDSRGD